MDFSNCRVTLNWSVDQRLMVLLGWEPLTVSEHLAKSGFHGSSASGDIKYLICHSTLTKPYN